MEEVFKYKSPLPSIKEIEEAYLLLQNYQVTLDQHAIVAITDVRGIITCVNHLFCKISEYNYDELIGKTHSIINSKSHGKEFFQDLWKTITQGKMWAGVICNKTKSGSLYWVKTTIFPFKDKDDKIQSYVSVRTDITEQINCLKELETTRILLEIETTKLLEIEKAALTHKNAALNEILSHLDDEKSKVMNSLGSNFELKIFPIIDKLKSANPLQNKYLQLLRTNLKEIAEPIFIKSHNYNISAKFSSQELQICNFIRKGLSTKEIAVFMHLSSRTIEKHRENIREKLGITDRKVSLSSFLLSDAR